MKLVYNCEPGLYRKREPCLPREFHLFTVRPLARSSGFAQQLRTSCNLILDDSTPPLFLRKQSATRNRGVFTWTFPRNQIWSATKRRRRVVEGQNPVRWCTWRYDKKMWLWWVNEIEGPVWCSEPLSWPFLSFSFFSIHSTFVLHGHGPTFQYSLFFLCPPCKRLQYTYYTEFKIRIVRILCLVYTFGDPLS